MNDLKFAFRQLVKNPGFTAVAVLTLALGIGVNVAVFSMANAILWRPLDLPEPNQLVQLGEGDLLNGNRGGVSASNFRDLAEHSRSFSRIAAMRTTALNLGGVGNPERLVGAEISEDYFSVLRVEPQLASAFVASQNGNLREECFVCRPPSRDPAIAHGKSCSLDFRRRIWPALCPVGFRPV